MEILHVAIDVTNLTLMQSFYEDLLGLKHSREFKTDEGHNYYVQDTQGTEIQFRVVEERTKPVGFHHLAISTEDVDQTVEEAVREFGSSITMGPRTLDRVDKRIAFLTDPEGYTVQLTEAI